MVGDFNIHVDNPKDSGTIEFNNILDSYGLTQHVTGPTHKLGHTLDLVITKGLNISNLMVTDVGLSDHSCIFFKMNISISNKGTTQILTKRHITEDTNKLFIEAFSSTIRLPSNSVDDMVDHFRSKTTCPKQNPPLVIKHHGEMPR